MPADRPTFESVRAAMATIAPHIHRTPVVTCGAIDRAAGCEVFLKCENFQKVGAFKARGACNAVMSLDDATAARGVVTHSSGNHAQALAWAAALRSIPAHIVMPSNAPPIKRRAVEEYGGKIYECLPTVADREATAARVQAETGATLIPPYNDERIIAGQGTCALEFLAQAPDLDAIIVPVGGGGMLAGTAITTNALAPNIAVFGAEPANADDAFRSLASGQIEPMDTPDTIADGLRTTLGTLTFPIIHDLVKAIVLVSEEEITAAMRLVLERAKLVVEPSGAVGIAAACTKACADYGFRKIGVIVTGGNVDVFSLSTR